VAYPVHSPFVLPGRLLWSGAEALRPGGLHECLNRVWLYVSFLYEEFSWTPARGDNGRHAYKGKECALCFCVSFGRRAPGFVLPAPLGFVSRGCGLANCMSGGGATLGADVEGPWIFNAL